MSKHLQRDLDQLQKDILALAGLVESAIHKAMRSLVERDIQLADEVIAGDDQIDREENHIDEECLKILALHQPVAVDLRRITSAMMIVIDLERMGDLAEEIAQQGLILGRAGPWTVPEKLQKLADLTTLVVRNSLDAFVRLDVDLARIVIRMEHQAFHLTDAIMEAVHASMVPGGDTIKQGIAFHTVTKALTRIAEHATNIAEDVIYLAEGEIVRHRGPNIMRSPA